MKYKITCYYEIETYLEIEASTEKEALEAAEGFIMPYQNDLTIDDADGYSIKEIKE